MSAPTTPPTAPWRTIVRPLAEVLAEDAPGAAAWTVPPPWTIRVDDHPPGPNDRLHGVARWRLCRPLRDAVAWQARALVRALRLSAPLPAARVQAHLIYRRRPFRDPDNAVASLKPLLDGLVTGGLLADDGPAHLELTPIVQELGPRRAIVLTIMPLQDPRAG